MKRLSENDHIDFYRHLAFCTVGGFFGAYAVLVHSGVMGNAQTMNLLEMVIDLLRWQLPDMLLHLGALALYVLGTMLTVLLPHWCGADTHYLSPIVTAVAAVVLALLPPQLNTVIALYPVFFAMSFQWSSFAGARGFYSATIFSTNNTKQSSLALAEYLCDHDRGAPAEDVVLSGHAGLLPRRRVVGVLRGEVVVHQRLAGGAAAGGVGIFSGGMRAASRGGRLHSGGCGRGYRGPALLQYVNTLKRTSARGQTSFFMYVISRSALPHGG